AAPRPLMGRFVQQSLLDAAEQLFVEQGVSRTTLQHIATAAGVTRGAIYWHFDDKGALFNAMMDRATLPFECALCVMEQANVSDPLHDVRDFMLEIFRVTEQEPGPRRVFEIASLKVEFVDELDAVRERRSQSQQEWMMHVEGRIRLGLESGQVRAGVNPRTIALGLWATMDGMIRNWMFEPKAFGLMETGMHVIDTLLDGIRARPIA
ncbi:TetR family transcriptional regulator, partial [Massilia brevitalea]|uniref:TetR family transcriptional regulator n=1 Tax=Massilia brevitalea TaxID=442526 RepID=UPI0028063B1E